MPEPTVLAFKGAKSQTGLATRKEFPGVGLPAGEPTFTEIATALRTAPALGILPMWNSHEGEIKKLQALDLLFQRAARLFRLWPVSIRFECLSRRVSGDGKLNSLISVVVAETQCSAFIKTTGASFIARDSTVDAYREFRADDRIDAALCAPEQNTDGFDVFCPDAANPLNFTTFALLGHVDSQKWLSDQWGSWEGRLFPTIGTFFGIEMSVSTVSLPEDQQQLLDDLTADADGINDIPKVLFVSRRREDSCGLLCEASGRGMDGDIVTEDGYSSKITVIPEIGVYNKRYSERAYEYLEQEHPTVLQHDFVRHIGTKTCFFACPPLQLITHGFEHAVVEPVVRRIVTKYFELYVNGMNCSDCQREFFERHRTAYLEQGPEFIVFHDAGI